MGAPRAVSIRPVTAEATRPLRLSILRRGQPPEAAVYPRDDDPATVHVGAFDAEGTLVGIATYLGGEARLAGQPPHVEPGARFRGMAVLESCRGEGVGTALVQHLRGLAREAGARELWANARQSAIGFYVRCGFRVMSSEFEVPQLGLHQVVAAAP